MDKDSNPGCISTTRLVGALYTTRPLAWGQKGDTCEDPSVLLHSGTLTRSERLSHKKVEPADRKRCVPFRTQVTTVRLLPRLLFHDYTKLLLSMIRCGRRRLGRRAVWQIVFIDPKFYKQALNLQNTASIKNSFTGFYGFPSSLFPKWQT